MEPTNLSKVDAIHALDNVASLTESKAKPEGKEANETHPQGNRATRRRKAKAARKAKKQAYKVLRGGIGNELIALDKQGNKCPQVE